MDSRVRGNDNNDRLQIVTNTVIPAKAGIHSALKWKSRIFTEFGAEDMTDSATYWL